LLNLFFVTPRAVPSFSNPIPQELRYINFSPLHFFWILSHFQAWWMWPADTTIIVIIGNSKFKSSYWFQKFVDKILPPLLNAVFDFSWTMKNLFFFSLSELHGNVGFTQSKFKWGKQNKFKISILAPRFFLAKVHLLCWHESTSNTCPVGRNPRFFSIEFSKTPLYDNLRLPHFQNPKRTLFAAFSFVVTSSHNKSLHLLVAQLAICFWFTCASVALFWGENEIFRLTGQSSPTLSPFRKVWPLWVDAFSNILQQPSF